MPSIKGMCNAFAFSAAACSRCTVAFVLARPTNASTRALVAAMSGLALHTKPTAGYSKLHPLVAQGDVQSAQSILRWLTQGNAKTSKAPGHYETH